MNHRNTLFVNEYIRTGNATASALKSGYSEKTAYSIGQRLLKNVEIRQAIKEHQAQMIKETEITVKEIVNDILLIAKNSQNESVRLRAYDMLMKHTGGYINDFNLLASLNENQIESLSNRLLKKLNDTEE
jgi:phage terminase small subunit